MAHICACAWAQVLTEVSDVDGVTLRRRGPGTEAAESPANKQ